jgi:hypothetical protein
MALNFGLFNNIFKPTFGDDEVGTYAGNNIIPRAYGSIITSESQVGDPNQDDVQFTTAYYANFEYENGTDMGLYITIPKEYIPCSIMVWCNAACGIKEEDDVSAWFRLRDTINSVTLAETYVQNVKIRNGDEYRIFPVSLMCIKKVTAAGTYAIRAQMKRTSIDQALVTGKLFTYLIYSEQQ